MNPLVIMVTFNRLRETRATLKALEATTDLEAIELVIVDNGSTDGTLPFLLGWSGEWYKSRPGPKINVYYVSTNIGCPKALNYALTRHRQPGQAMVKIDNDVRLLMPGWVGKVRRLIEGHEAQGRPVAMVGAYYDGVLGGRLRGREGWEGKPLYHVQPVVGHCVWHAGAFLDAVGHFDVLAEDHLYGFEDLIMSHKAGRMGWEMLAWEGWRIENLQRHSALGREKQDEHVERMRPLYDQRVAALTAGGTVWTGEDGQPGTRENEGKVFGKGGGGM